MDEYQNVKQKLKHHHDLNEEFFLPNSEIIFERNPNQTYIQLQFATKLMKLLSRYSLNDLDLSNRMVMAPMTRCRAIEGNVPNPLSIQYYQQRASAGLLITEGSQVDPMGIGYTRTPGIHTNEQIIGWKKVTEGVHQAGGKIFLQLWHVGRMSHPDFLEGALPVAPSAIRFDSEIHTPGGKKKIPVPRALEKKEILEIVEKFRIGARNAKKAGFDGVEIHGANGYLLDQFLRDGSNTRTDLYGGSVENRTRFPLDVARAVTSEWESGRVGYRISPHFLLNGMSDSNPKETFSYLTRELDKIGIGYIHLIEPIGGRMGVTPPGAHLASVIRSIFPRTLILNGGYNAQIGNAMIEEGNADLISFGIPFLANPDLPERFKRAAPLNKEDIATFYAGEEKGYTDYPTLEI